MRGRLAAALLGLCVLCQGCGPLADTAHTMLLEPVEYPRRLEACVDCKRAEKLAAAAWAEYLAAEAEAHSDVQYTCDFGQGFKDGYADYLFAGGTGNPPPLPPRWYWRAENKTPAGRLGEQDWFRGFRTGAALAKLSGYREIETVGSWTSVYRAQDGADAAPSTAAKAAVLPPPQLETAPPAQKPAVELGPPPRPTAPPPADEAKAAVLPPAQLETALLPRSRRSNSGRRPGRRRLRRRTRRMG